MQEHSTFPQSLHKENTFLEVIDGLKLTTKEVNPHLLTILCISIIGRLLNGTGVSQRSTYAPLHSLQVTFWMNCTGVDLSMRNTTCCPLVSVILAFLFVMCLTSGTPVARFQGQARSHSTTRDWLGADASASRRLESLLINLERYATKLTVR